MTHLKKPIEKYMLPQTPSLQRLALADTYGLTELREVCLKCAIKDSINTYYGGFTQLQPSTKVEILLPKLAAAEALINENNNLINGISQVFDGSLWRWSTKGTCPKDKQSKHILGKEESCDHCLHHRIKTIQEMIREKN